jgi:hypothetical protein
MYFDVRDKGRRRRQALNLLAFCQYTQVDATICLPLSSVARLPRLLAAQRLSRSSADSINNLLPIQAQMNSRNLDRLSLTARPSGPSSFSSLLRGFQAALFFSLPPLAGFIARTFVSTRLRSYGTLCRRCRDNPPPRIQFSQRRENVMTRPDATARQARKTATNCPICSGHCHLGIGAMAGGVFGLIGARFGGGLVDYAASVAAVIIMCWCIHVGTAARLGAITATIVLLVPEKGPRRDVALLRLDQVTLGTVCALAVSWLVSRAEHVWTGRDQHASEQRLTSRTTQTPCRSDLRTVSAVSRSSENRS